MSTYHSEQRSMRFVSGSKVTLFSVNPPASPPRLSVPWGGAIVCGTLLFFVYLWTVTPTFYWLDSSEFVAASWTLGIAHPPGHPLAALLSRVGTFFPWGTIAFRVNLASAAQAALIGGFLFLIIFEVLRRHQHEPLLDDQHDDQRDHTMNMLFAGSSALTAALSYAIWFQAIRAEVYALNLLLLCGATWCLLRWDSVAERPDRRALFFAAWLIGLALCNHHFLVVLALPAGIGYVVTGWIRRNDSNREISLRRESVGLVLALCLGLAVLAYLPLRAMQTPLVNWGSPTTWSQFVWVVSAKAFHKSTHRAAETTGLDHSGISAAFMLVEESVPWAAPFALFGLYILWRQRHTRRIAMLISLMIGGNLLGLIVIGFDPFNPDARGYLSVSVVFFIIPIVVVLHTILNRVRGSHRVYRAVKVALVLFATALPLYQGVTQYKRCQLLDRWEAEETTRQMMSLPSGSLLFTSYFGSVFNVWALQSAAGHRPDVTVFHRNFLQQPGYLDRWSEKHPALSRYLVEWKQQQRLNIDSLVEIETTRPVFFEYDLNIPQEIDPHLTPNGLSLRFSKTTEPIRSSIETHRQRIETWHDAIGFPQSLPLMNPETFIDLETQRAMLWTHYLLLRFACVRRDQTLSTLHYRYAHALAPMARQLVDLKAQCGIAD